MSLSALWAALGQALYPDWLQDWLWQGLFPRLGLEPRQMMLGVVRGMWDMLLYLLVGTAMVSGGRLIMDGQFALPRSTQETVLQWAPVADAIARRVDIPREVPLVIWFKENSLLAENPVSCTGIMGAYDLVRSGEHPCFAPGPISDVEIAQQLSLGAVEFKKRCPDIHYYSQNPALLKRCYFAYNAGITASQTLDADNSAYVMNGYSEAYTNMVYQDIELGTVTVTALGAYPAHLSMQSLIASQADSADGTLSLTLLDLGTRFYDWASYKIQSSPAFGSSARLTMPHSRQLAGETCLAAPHFLGNPLLRPTLSPVAEEPILTQDIHGCSYSLPGLDISSENRTTTLLAPMSGTITTYTDQWRNSTIRIENEEWIVWLLHPRSYLVEEGTVKKGQPVGIMGAVGNATGPHVHYTVFDKSNDTFVDPALLIAP